MIVTDFGLVLRRIAVAMNSTPMRQWYRISAMMWLVLFAGGCNSQSDRNRADSEPKAVAEISTRDRLRLTLADAAAAGIHLFDLKLIREDIMTLQEKEPELAAALLSDLDRVEALPKTEHLAKAKIGREMYERIKIPR